MHFGDYIKINCFHEFDEVIYQNIAHTLAKLRDWEKEILIWEIILSMRS